MKKLNKYTYNSDHKFNYLNNKTIDAIYHFREKYTTCSNIEYNSIKRHINKNIFGIQLTIIK